MRRLLAFKIRYATSERILASSERHDVLRQAQHLGQRVACLLRGTMLDYIRLERTSGNFSPAFFAIVVPGNGLVLVSGNDENVERFSGVA